MRYALRLDEVFSFTSFVIVNMKTIEYPIKIVPHETIRNETKRSYKRNFFHWAEALFYYRVMEYLDWHEPRELLREEFRMNCQRIYDEDKELYERAWLTYEYLYWNDDWELHEILEARADCFLYEDEW